MRSALIRAVALVYVFLAAEDLGGPESRPLLVERVEIPKLKIARRAY